MSSTYVAHEVPPACHAAHTVAAVTAVRVSIVGNNKRKAVREGLGRKARGEKRGPMFIRIQGREV